MSAVSSPEAMLEHEWPPGPHRTIPCRDRFRAVIRMDDVARSPHLQLLERHSEVIQDAMIDELERAIGGMDRNEAGYGVDNQPKTLGAETQSVFCGDAMFKHHGVRQRSLRVSRDRLDSESRFWRGRPDSVLWS